MRLNWAVAHQEVLSGSPRRDDGLIGCCWCLLSRVSLVRIHYGSSIRLLVAAASDGYSSPSVSPPHLGRACCCMRPGFYCAHSHSAKFHGWDA